jgi:hypothetical protein
MRRSDHPILVTMGIGEQVVKPATIVASFFSALGQLEYNRLTVGTSNYCAWRKNFFQGRSKYEIGRSRSRKTEFLAACIFAEQSEWRTLQ